MRGSQIKTVESGLWTLGLPYTPDQAEVHCIECMNTVNDSHRLQGVGCHQYHQGPNNLRQESGGELVSLLALVLGRYTIPPAARSVLQPHPKLSAHHGVWCGVRSWTRVARLKIPLFTHSNPVPGGKHVSKPLQHALTNISLTPRPLSEFIWASPAVRRRLPRLEPNALTARYPSE